MSKTIKLSLLFFLQCLGLHAQYEPNFDIAPCNPVPEFHTLHAEHVTGDVYALDEYLYDKNGKQVLTGLAGKVTEFCKYSKEEAKALRKYYCLRDEKDRLIERGSYDADGTLNATQYFYKNGLFIKQVSKWNTRNFEYDKKGRIILSTTIHPAKDDQPEVETYTKYTYQDIENGEIKVTMESKYYNGDITYNTYHYKNGLITYSERNKYTYEYKFDEKGNWVYNRFSPKEDRFSKKVRSIIYYSDFKKPSFHFAPDPRTEYTSLIYPYLNDKIFRAAQRTIIGKKNKAYEVFYFPLVNYYVVPDVNLLPTLDGRVTRAEAKAVYNTQMAYYRNISTNKFVVLDKGERMSDYSKFGKWEFLENGDPVITVNKIPTYILKDYYQAKDKELKPVLPYNGEPLKLASVVASTDSNQEKKAPTTTTLICKKGNCIDGYGIATKGTIEYEGEFKNGQPHGIIVATQENGNYYRGEYAYGKRNGSGTYYWKETDQYYIGSWKNNVQHGYGINKKGKKILNAGILDSNKFTLSLGTQYVNKKISGSCRGNCSNGFGGYRYRNGGQSVGFWKNSKLSNYSLTVFGNGDSYVGKYVNGLRSGFGEYFWKNGTSYTGNWLNNKEHGFGILIYSNGQQKVGYWENGNYIGTSKRS
ncbi:hypothetical protein AAT17_04380 [Nonlabens sp. MIC269]|uniref:MORN repeat-containing protein n=1 Tax=Nonlabens sp. MIC269 TaxID=1476901 RepID=UPI0007230346|nr:hypothetical protein [Nonlabens sp. MIC269]ALM20526.1 hypothetical protein AAT17_04380 [Nonlabens sp. MIC269]